MFGFLVRKKAVERVGKVAFRMQVPAEVREEAGMFYSSCPVLDVHSQGHSQKEALENLIEALTLFVETCYEQGTLGQLLRQIGLVPAHGEDVFAAEQCTVEVPLALIAREHAANHAY